MKRCPTCQRTYTDDSLRFCLQDGATLLSVSDAHASFDPEATLHIAAPPGSTSDQPTEVFNPRAAPTIRSPQPAPATTPQQRLDTRETQSPLVAAATTTTAAPPAAPSRALTAGVFAIAALLLALVGIGVALLLRSSPESNRNTTNVDVGASGANKNTNTNANTNDRANNNVNASASPGPTTNNSAPAVNTNIENRNTSTTQDAASRAEAKILRDAPLTEGDLVGLTPTELRRLRNTVYARHGRTFETPELQRYFDARPWYRPRPDYSDQQLTPTDRANVKLIQAAE